MTDSAVAPSKVSEIDFGSDEAGVALKLMATGDMSDLTDNDKMTLYIGLCRATGINPAFRPFGIIKTKEGQKLYAFKSAAEQLRKLNNLTITDSKQEVLGTGSAQVLLVTVWMQDNAGRMGYDVGAVSLAGLGGENLANAYMKAHTKAVRRCTLGMAGLGILDESELDGVAGAEIVEMPTKPKPDYKMPAIEESVPSEQIATIKHGEVQPDPAKPANAKQKALAALHARGSELNMDHDALKKLASHIYYITSMSELTAPQLTTLNKMLDDGGDLELAMDIIYTAHALGSKQAHDRLVGAKLSSSQKRAVYAAIALADEIRTGNPAEQQVKAQNEDGVTILGVAETEGVADDTGTAGWMPPVDDGDWDAAGTPDNLQADSGPPLETRLNQGEPVPHEEIEATFTVTDAVPMNNDSIPDNWTDLWKFLRKNGIKGQADLLKLIGPLQDDSAKSVYKRVALALTNA